METKTIGLKHGDVLCQEEIAEGGEKIITFKVPLFLEINNTFPGDILDRLYFILDAKDVGELKIPIDFIAANKTKMVSITPDSVFFMTSKTEMSNLTKTVKYTFKDVVSLPEIELRIDKNLPIVYELVENQNSYNIVLKIDTEKLSTLPLGLSKGKIEILPNVESISKIDLPISIFIRK